MERTKQKPADHRRRRRPACREEKSLGEVAAKHELLGERLNAQGEQREKSSLQ
jgi:hypothetical protein